VVQVVPGPLGWAGWQVPAVQKVPLPHSELLLQLALHTLTELQTPVRHWPAATQGPPAGWPHLPSRGSHTPEEHWAGSTQSWPLPCLGVQVLPRQ
jgi:hypothetical protein